MRKQGFFAVFLSIVLTAGLLVGSLLPASAAGYDLPEDTTLYAESAILVNLAGQPEEDIVLFEKKADEVHAPGAMMRYMVVAYALHRIDELGMDMDTATGAYTIEMFNRHVAGTGVATANMAFGEMWTVRDLLAATFIQSASDAATTLAYALDGGVTAFVKGMNDLAKEIGCDFSHFANMTGVDSLAQYTTARDMYRIIRYAQQFSEFEDIVGKRQITVKAVSGGGQHTLVSANAMLQSTSQFRYTPLVHSRTGLSEHEGRTCASVARDSGYEYLVVVLGCPEQNKSGESGLHYRDTRTLFRWAFNNFTYTTVLAEDEILASAKVNLSWSRDHINLVPKEELATVVESGLKSDQIIKKVTLYQDEVDAPIEKGQVLGKVELIVNVDQKIGEMDLVAYESINRNWLLYAWRNVVNFLGSVWFLLGLGVVLLLAAAYALLNILHNRQRRQERLGRVRPQK